MAEVTSHLTKPSTLLSALLAFIAYGIVLAVYRLYFSPLAKFPGPKLAAATAWYEFYFDCICHGRYFLEVKKAHAKYGELGSNIGLIELNRLIASQVPSFASRHGSCTSTTRHTMAHYTLVARAISIHSFRRCWAIREL
jgi:hypothetical protein